MAIIKNWLRCVGLVAVGGILFFSAHARTTYLLFDLGGVLATPNRLKMVRTHIGFAPLFRSALCDLVLGHMPGKEKQMVFDLLYRCGQQTGDEMLKVRDDTGKALPAIMVDWLTGAKTTSEIINHMDMIIAESARHGYFPHVASRITCQKIIKAIFTPEVLVHCFDIIDQGVAVVQQAVLSEQYTVCIASNLDPASFALLRDTKKGSQICCQVDPHHLFVSGMIGIAKPDPAFWQHIVDTLGVAPCDCVLIDDQIENILSAQRAGIKTYLFNGDYKNLQHYLFG